MCVFFYGNSKIIYRGIYPVFKHEFKYVHKMSSILGIIGSKLRSPKVFETFLFTLTVQTVLELNL